MILSDEAIAISYWISTQTVFDRLVPKGDLYVFATKNVSNNISLVSSCTLIIHFLPPGTWSGILRHLEAESELLRTATVV
jgi:hypothetical protein